MTTTLPTYNEATEIHDRLHSLITATRADLRPEHTASPAAARSLQDALEALRSALRSMEHGGIAR